MTSDCKKEAHGLCPFRMRSQENPDGYCLDDCALYTGSQCGLLYQAETLGEMNASLPDIADAIRDVAREVRYLRDDIYRLNSK